MVSESQLAGTWNLDAEAAWQFGRDDFGSVNRDKVQAGMAASTGGYTFDELPWTPGLGGIFWWGSGGKLEHQPDTAIAGRLAVVLLW